MQYIAVLYSRHSYPFSCQCSVCTRVTRAGGLNDIDWILILQRVFFQAESTCPICRRKHMSNLPQKASDMPSMWRRKSMFADSRSQSSVPLGTQLELVLLEMAACALWIASSTVRSLQPKNGNGRLYSTDSWLKTCLFHIFWHQFLQPHSRIERPTAGLIKIFQMQFFYVLHNPSLPVYVALRRNLAPGFLNIAALPCVCWAREASSWSV